MATMTRLVASAEALAALAARLRADVEGIALDPEIESALDEILAELGVDMTALSEADLGSVRPRIWSRTRTARGGGASTIRSSCAARAAPRRRSRPRSRRCRS